MSFENTRYIELTFINDLDGVKKQIRNTILFLFLSEKYGVTVLSDYLEGTQYGYTASAKVEGIIKLLRITDITEGRVNWDTVPYCQCDEQTKYLLKQDDILVARTGGTTGKSFIVKDVPSNVVYASYLIRLRLKNENNPEFVSAFFNSYTYWSQLVELKRGAAQPNVNAEKLKKIIIPNCPPDVQDKYVSYLNGDFSEDILDKRINEILSLFDSNQALKGKHSYQLDLLKKLRQQILQDAVQGKLVPQDPNDEPATILLERIKKEKQKLISEGKLKKDKPLPPIKPEEIPFEIPENWVWCTIPQVASNEKNALKAGPFGSSLKKEFYADKGYKIYGQEQVINQDPFYGEYYINEERYRLLKSCRVKPGDILISLVGTMGKVLILPEKIEEGIINPRLVKISLYESINREYIKWYLYSPSALKQIHHFSHGSTMDIINLGIINKLLIPLPPICQQNKIVLKIEQLLKLCDELEQSIQQNQKYSQELLQVALKEALKPKE
jgi:type I restriction enzyme S subunit